MDGESTRCDYYVHKITYLKFKGRKRFLHEFLLIKIVHGSSGQALCVLTERSPQKGATATSRDDRRCSNQMIAHSVSGRVAAKDAVQVVGDDHISQLVSSCDKLAELTFDPGKLRPLNLAILLTVVSNYAPDYDILDYQCYWYAATIYQSSKDLFHPSEEFVEAAPSNAPRKYVFGLPPSKDSVRAILTNYKLETKQYREEKMEKENARRAEEKKVGFLDPKALLCPHALAVDRAARPGNGAQKERKEGEGATMGILQKDAGKREEGARKRKEGAGKRKEGTRKRGEGEGGTANA